MLQVSAQSSFAVICHFTLFKLFKLTVQYFNLDYFIIVHRKPPWGICRGIHLKLKWDSVTCKMYCQIEHPRRHILTWFKCSGWQVSVIDINVLVRPTVVPALYNILKLIRLIRSQKATLRCTYREIHLKLNWDTWATKCIADLSLSKDM